MFCHKCGMQTPEDSDFCRKCGVKLTNDGEPQQQESQQEFQQQEPQQQQSQPQSRNDDKLMAVLSYLGVLWLIPLCTNAYKNSEFVKFHFNQGAIILIIAIGWGVISSILRGIFFAMFFWFPFVSVLVNVVISVLSLGVVALIIIGIVGAAKDKMEPLPIIGDIKLFK